MVWYNKRVRNSKTSREKQEAIECETPNKLQAGKRLNERDCTMSDVQNTTNAITFSQTAVQAVLSSICNGDDDFVKSFFAARPEWQDETTEQTDDRKEAAQA